MHMHFVQLDVQRRYDHIGMDQLQNSDYHNDHDDDGGGNWDNSNDDDMNGDSITSLGSSSLLHLNKNIKPCDLVVLVSVIVSGSRLYISSTATSLTP